MQMYEFFRGLVARQEEGVVNRVGDVDSCGCVAIMILGFGGAYPCEVEGGAFVNILFYS